MRKVGKIEHKAVVDRDGSQNPVFPPAEATARAPEHDVSSHPAEKLPGSESALCSLSPTLPPQRKRFAPLLSGLVCMLVVASALFVPLMLAAPPSHPGALALGTLDFTSSGQVDASLTQGYNDIITLTFSQALPAPDAGLAYAVWLMPDQTDDSTLPLLLGMLHAGESELTYISPAHTNLLAFYSGVRVTEQSAGSTPRLPSQNPAMWRWQGWIPNVPTPGDEQHYSLLSHMRHLLAADPVLQANGLSGGLALWMTRNVAKVEEWAEAAQGQWHGTATSPADMALIQRQMTRMLDYLDGAAYVWRDVPAGSPWLVDQAGGKIGLINRVPEQNPPAYLEHVALHLQGLASAPGHTSAQQQLSLLVNTVIQRMQSNLVRVRQDASAVARMNLAQVRQPGTLAPLDEMASLTMQVASGWLDPVSGEDIGGAFWIMARLQRLATISLSPADAREEER
jgi:hypothetical protein